MLKPREDPKPGGSMVVCTEVTHVGDSTKPGIQLSGQPEAITWGGAAGGFAGDCCEHKCNGWPRTVEGTDRL